MEQPNYYAVLPAEVRYDKKLSSSEKLMYGEITALAQLTGECWAGNKYFAELYNVTNTCVSLWIKNLVDTGHIQSTLIYEEGTQKILKRSLKILKGGIQKNLKDNNTSINNTSISMQIASVIKFMEEIDPQNSEFYGNTTQRQACEFLIKQYGIEEVERFIKFISKNMDKIFNPPTTPYKLKKEWVRVMSEVGYKINKQRSKNQEVIIS